LALRRDLTVVKKIEGTAAGKQELIRDIPASSSRAAEIPRSRLPRSP